MRFKTAYPRTCADSRPTRQRYTIDPEIAAIQLPLGTFPRAWCRPHPHCDEYIDWGRYNKLVLDAPITAPLMGITTFDTERLP